jgi:CubicO group peptidase (beta-lactamase class C family)
MMRRALAFCKPPVKGAGRDLSRALIRFAASHKLSAWPGASGADWWADPKEDLAVVYLSAAPGPIRWHYRQKINALVYQAIME